MLAPRGFKHVVLLALIAVASHVDATQAAELTAQQASDHIGEIAAVCGTVVSSTFASRSRGQPTFLNLDQPYPNHIFTVVIWREDRTKFGQPEIELANKRICAHGLIAVFKARPEIVARDPSQLTIDR